MTFHVTSMPVIVRQPIFAPSYLSLTQKGKIWGQVQNLDYGLDYGLDCGLDYGLDYRLDYGLDYGLDYELDYELDSGLDSGPGLWTGFYRLESRTYELTSHF